ncbi:MAG: hydrogenase [Acidiferrobacter sp.]
MPIYHLQPLAASIFSLLAIVALVLSFVMLSSHWLKNHIYAFALESWVIAGLSTAVAYYGHFDELYIIAALTALFRGSLLPYLILRLVRRLGMDREFTSFLRPSSSMVLGAMLVIFAFAVARTLGHQLHLLDTLVILALTCMFGLKLVGFLLMVLRSEAISHILGLLVIENGIFLGSQILVPGMPLLLELVILFDLLIIVLTFGVLVRYLKIHAGTTSSRHLQRLVG